MSSTATNDFKPGDDATVSRDATGPTPQTLQQAGIITFGPERAFTQDGRELHRFVLCQVGDPKQSLRPLAVICDAPFARSLDNITPGTFVTIEGMARAGIDGSSTPWHAWATSIRFPDRRGDIGHASADPPITEATIARAFEDSVALEPKRHGIRAATTFEDALREPYHRAGTTLEDPWLTDVLSAYGGERGLSPSAEHAIRFAFAHVNAKLPGSIASDLSTWSHEAGLGDAFSIERRRDAIRREFNEQQPIHAKTLEPLGIAPHTLDAPPFRAALRAQSDGVLALHVDRNGPVSIVRTGFERPDRSLMVTGSTPGLWISSATDDRLCDKIIVTQTPLTALAHYQQNPAANVRYVAVGGNELAEEQKLALQQFLGQIERLSGRKPELVVTADHKALGLKLFEQVRNACPELAADAILPKRNLGRDWVEAARAAREPERQVDLPAYAASRLGYEELYRSPNNQQTVMGLRSKEPTRAVQAQRPNAINSQVPAGEERLLFTRQPDGSWRYENDRSRPDDRGQAADFARSRLRLSLDDFRSDVRRFAIEQDLRGSQVIAADARELSQRGIRPETIQAACFRGTLRQDENGRLVCGQQDRSGLCGVERVPLREPIASATGRDISGSAGLWMSREQPGREAVRRLVVVDSPLTALAYHQEHPASAVRYIAIGGRPLTPEQRTTLEATVKAATRANHDRPIDLVVATTRDRAGEAFARDVAAASKHEVRRDAPIIGKDWLETAQRRQRDFIRAVGARPSRTAGHSL
jgi:hypothetical protein